MQATEAMAAAGPAASILMALFLVMLLDDLRSRRDIRPEDTGALTRKHVTGVRRGWTRHPCPHRPYFFKFHAFS